MDDLHFYEYVMFMLKEAGHVTTLNPIYTNHSSDDALYIDSTKNVVINSADRELLALIYNVSLLADIKWQNSVESFVEDVQIFSITVGFHEWSRSQNIADIHYLLQKYWSCNHSVVFFKNMENYAISFADNNYSHILSDWREISITDDLIERIGIENISVETCDNYFYDFIYSIARKYYIYPISFEEATYNMLPVNYVSNGLFTGVLLSREEMKQLIIDNMACYEEKYGNDYIEPVYANRDRSNDHQDIFSEIDLISFELELNEKLDNEAFDESDFGDVDSDYDEDLLLEDSEDGDEDEDIDPAIYDDPILMVKWLEQKQKKQSHNSSFGDAG